MDPSQVGYGQATPNANFQQVHQGIPPPSTEPVYCPATIASNAYPPVVPGQFSSSQQNQYQQHGTTAVAVTVMNVEQCCVCSNFYEQQSRHIPQPDLNRMICKLLDVAPQENSFFREYLAVCINCTNLLRKFDRLRVELEFVKTQVVTYVIETFTQIRPEGGTPMDTLRNQILNRWTNVSGTGKKRKEGYSAADKTSNPSNELSFAALNNIIKNPTVVEPAESWNVGTEITVRSNAASTSTPAKEVSSHSTPEDVGNDDPDYDDGDFGNDDHHSYANDDSNDEGEGSEVKDAVANIPKATNIRPRSSASPKRRKNKQVGGVKPKRVRKLQPYKPLPNEVAPLICTLCGRMYDRMCNYNAHTQACYGDDSVMEKNCYICSEQKNEPCMFDTWDDYKTHIYAYHPVVKLERCSFCRSRFLPNGVKRHKCFAYKRQVHKDAIFKCDRCDRAYNSRSNLTDHVRRIHKDEQHTCDICQKSYGSPMLLNLHVGRHRLIVSKFQCTECGVCLSSSFSLKEHLKRHKGTPQFECEICGRKFYQRSTFKNHALVHSNLKPHVCHLCGTKFKLKSTLRRHIVRHEVKETNYTKKCPLCPKAMFRKVWVLKRHMDVEHPFTQEREDIIEKYKDVDDFPHRNKAANAKRYDKAGKNRSTANARIKTEPLDSDEASASENDDDWDDKDNSDSEQPQKNMPSTSTSSPARKSARLENRGLTSKSLVVILQKDSSVDAKLNAS